MQIVVDPDRRADAVERLVRTRLDREGGCGTYADALARVAAGGPGATHLRAALERARERADRHVRDVLAALVQSAAG